MKKMEYKDWVFTSDYIVKKAGLIACSNGLSESARIDIENLTSTLKSFYRDVVPGKYLFDGERSDPGNGSMRAKELMRLYREEDITDIFDVSGGDMANEILDDLDYEEIARSKITFWGYSDLTTVLNAIYTMTGRKSNLYQIKNLVWSYAQMQQERFKEQNKLFDLDYEFIQGEDFSGTLVGGNIRCFLKLAGTRYFPDMKGKILLLEAMGGEVPQMVTYLSQLKQLGVFNQISGIVLGTFSNMEMKAVEPPIEVLTAHFAGDKMPIVKTRDIGHGKDAKAAMIGAEYIFEKDKKETYNIRKNKER
jgi:muramoyltetrapeptide carboxypeptidase LdcA involved in peptidoglycan recycling